MVIKNSFLALLLAFSSCSPAIAGVVTPPSPWNRSGVDLTYLAGNVGIGSTTPRNAIEVNGTVKATAITTASSNLPQLNLGPTQTSDTHYSVGVLADGGNDNDDPFIIGTGNDLTTPKFQILNGNVGIGSTAPGTTIDAGPTGTYRGTFTGTPISGSIDTATLAATDGTLTFKCDVDVGDDFRILTDSSNPPTTAIAIQSNASATTAFLNTITAPVKKGNYWLAKTQAGTCSSPIIYFTPIGQ